MLWYNNPESVQAIRESRINRNTNTTSTRLMRLARTSVEAV